MQGALSKSPSTDHVDVDDALQAETSGIGQTLHLLVKVIASVRAGQILSQAQSHRQTWGYTFKGMDAAG